MIVFVVNVLCVLGSVWCCLVVFCVWIGVLVGVVGLECRMLGL